MKRLPQSGLKDSMDNEHLRKQIKAYVGANPRN